MNLEKQSVREFSKEQSSKERTDTARKIREIRSGFFERIREISERTKELRTRAQLNRVNADDAFLECEALKEELTEYEGRALTKLMSFLKIPNSKIEELKTEIEKNEDVQAQFLQDYEEFGNAIEGLERQREDRSILVETKNILAQFYAGQSDRWNAYEKQEREARDIKNVMEKFEAVFIHSIHPTFIPGSNSLLDKSVDWKTKLDILLAFSPTVATSTIRMGDTSRNMWACMGVLLKGGTVMNAHASDAGSRAQGLTERLVWTSTDRLSKDIEIAIFNRRYSGHKSYNELGVSNPSIAGFYFSQDSQQTGGYPEIVPLAEIGAHCRALGMPLFEIVKGVVHRAEILESGEVIRGEKISKKELISSPYEVTDSMRAHAEQTILEHSPFKIIPKDASLIDAAGEGRATYAAIRARKGEGEKLGGKKIRYVRAPNETTNRIPEGSDVTLIAAFPRLGSRRELYLSNNLILERVVPSRRSQEKKGVPLENSEMVRIDDRRVRFDDTYIWIGAYSHDLKRPLLGSGDYLEGMRESIDGQFNKVRMESLKFAKNETERANINNYWDWILQLLAAHLYGFGIQAEAAGDIQTKERAFAIASTVIPYDSYKEIEERRVDSNGRLRITKEDLKAQNN